MLPVERRCLWKMVRLRKPVGQKKRVSRSMKNFITAIYFHCGGLNMDPLHLPN
jgi:hypothetical protein